MTPSERGGSIARMLAGVSARMCGVRLANVVSASCEALLPCLCLYCGEPIGGDRAGLCGPCWALVVPRAGGQCPRCGGPAEDGSAGCLGCASASLPQSATVIWGEYEGPLRAAVLALKGGGHDQLAQPLGRRLAARLALEQWAASVEVVVPVPSHPLRRLRTGWPAAACLAEVVARELGQPMMPLLERHGLARQTGRRRGERRRLPRSAFSCSGRVEARRILIVDDVVTTGTTLVRAAAAARRMGAEEVVCAAVAATPDARRVT
jgi:ComF family protein